MNDLERQIEVDAEITAFAIVPQIENEIDRRIFNITKRSFVVGARSQSTKEFWQQGMYDRKQLSDAIEAGINEGLRKQQQGLYSEAEVINLIIDAFLIGSKDLGSDYLREWFEESKKK